MADDIGSTWRKWDLHIHCPNGKLASSYEGEHALDIFCKKLELSDVSVFGITDYFSAKSYFDFKERFYQLYPNSEKRFFFNLELRLNESVNSVHEEVNLHVIFNPDAEDKINKFLSVLKVVKTGRGNTPITCLELGEADYASATVARVHLLEAIKDTFGNSKRLDNLMIVTACNNDGIRPERGAQRKESITDEIDKISDAFFGNAKNSTHFLDRNRLEDPSLNILPKPVIAGSDCHTFDELDVYLGKQYTEEKGGVRITVKDITWIKADPTFDGLKQIIYEPNPGERIQIGGVKPDEKNDYQVISKIIFNDNTNFPEEVHFNPNLNSIIGSRSSGKSALLTYVAHTVDRTGVEAITKGPGEGEEFRWGNISTKQSVVWANGKANEESPGKVVFLPQNHLFKKGMNPTEIKAKIEPILSHLYPEEYAKYQKGITELKALNHDISLHTDNWFELKAKYEVCLSDITQLGSKQAIQQELDATNKAIQQEQLINKLEPADVSSYQVVTQKIASLKSDLAKTDLELKALNLATVSGDYFTDITLEFSPSLDSLPSKISKEIFDVAHTSSNSILLEANKQVTKHRATLSQTRIDTADLISKIEETSRPLFEKYKANIALITTIEKRNSLEGTLKLLNLTSERLQEIDNAIKVHEREIESKLSVRQEILKQLPASMNNMQTDLEGLKFGLEVGFLEEEAFVGLVNLKETTSFVRNGLFSLDSARTNSKKLLCDIYNGTQKIIARHDKKETAKTILTTTETLLLTAEMEGDKIGGFAESTMTPGKRALFALRLLLIESNDTWPILVDQPEDDLDSRSLYNEIVPFLKQKKKERQIIMVSHNANLVIGADSEEVIVANRNGADRLNQDGRHFNYLSGSLENKKLKDLTCKDTLLSQGICEHACEILDGGKEAFESRLNKYNFL